MEMSRREFLSFTVTVAGLATVIGCAGGGGTELHTVLQLTQAQGYQVEYDPDRSIGSAPYVKSLIRDGQTVLTGDLYFTVNGQPYYDQGQTGSKSVNSLVNAGDEIAWRVR